MNVKTKKLQNGKTANIKISYPVLVPCTMSHAMISRTRFKKQIVCEFVPPKNTRSRKVIILCHGLPSIPKKNSVMKFLAGQGYWVFFPRYRGSWESDGKFLEKSPHKDILDVIDGIEKGFTDLYDQTSYKLKPSQLILIGSSFGGPAVLLAGRDKRVDKVIAFSPVTDWRADSKIEPLDFLGKYIKQAFGNAYRFSQKDWNKLEKGIFYNPIKKAKEIDGKKILIFHAKDDLYVPYESVKVFARLTGATFVLANKGGHYSTSLIEDDTFFKKIRSFM